MVHFVVLSLLPSSNQDNNQVDKSGRWVGARKAEQGFRRAALDIPCVRWSWDCSVLCCVVLGWTEIPEFCCCAGLCGPVVPLWMLLLLVYDGSRVVS